MLAEIIIGGVFALILAFGIITFAMSIQRKRLIKKYNINDDLSRNREQGGVRTIKEAELITAGLSELEGDKLLQTTEVSSNGETSSSPREPKRLIDKLLRKLRK